MCDRNRIPECIRDSSTTVGYAVDDRIYLVMTDHIVRIVITYGGHHKEYGQGSDHEYHHECGHEHPVIDLHSVTYLCKGA